MNLRHAVAASNQKFNKKFGPKDSAKKCSWLKSDKEESCVVVIVRIRRAVAAGTNTINKISLSTMFLYQKSESFAENNTRDKKRNRVIEYLFDFLAHWPQAPTSFQNTMFLVGKCDKNNVAGTQ